MAYYRRRKSYGGSVSLIMTFLLGFALGMSVMYLFMTLITGREGSGVAERAAQLPDKPLNAAASLQHIPEGQGRYLVPVISPEMLLRVWRNVIPELRPIAVVLRLRDSEDPRTVREALDLLAALPQPPVVLMEPATLIPPADPDAKYSRDAIPERLLDTLRQWGGSGWPGPCLAYAPNGEEVSLFGLRMTPEAAVKVGLEINRVLLEHGMAAVAWPFPGAPSGHSPEGYPWITESDYDVLAEMVAPFLQAIQSGTPAVVAAHVIVPALDPRPACASPVIIRELLREKWQFDGLILGDAAIPLNMADDEDPATLPVRCLAAGCDAALVDFDHQDTAVGVLMSFDLKALPADQLAESSQRLERFRTRYAGPKNIVAEPSPDQKDASTPPPDEAVSLPENQPGVAPSTVDEMLFNAPVELTPPEDGSTTAVQTISTFPEDTKDSEPDTMDYVGPVTAAEPSDAGDAAAAAQFQPAEADLAPSASESDQTPLEIPETSAAQEPTAHPPVPNAPEGPFIEHRIEPGEGLAAIARKYGVPLADLKLWNGITDPDRIVAGTRIKIYGARIPEPHPTEAESPAQAEPASGAALDDTSDKVVPSDIQPDAEVPVVPEIKAPSQTVFSKMGENTVYDIYVVQPGDTLSRIAGKYGVSLTELMQINNIRDKNLVKLGSKIKVPVRAGSSPEPFPVSE